MYLSRLALKPKEWAPIWELQIECLNKCDINKLWNYNSHQTPIVLHAAYACRHIHRTAILPPFWKSWLLSCTSILLYQKINLMHVCFEQTLTIYTLLQPHSQKQLLSNLFPHILMNTASDFSQHNQFRNWPQLRSDTYVKPHAGVCCRFFHPYILISYP